MKKDQDSHLLIQGNFSQPRSIRMLRMAARLMSLLLCLVLFSALILYGVRVHYESNINQVAKDARELSEENKELLVRLNRIRSFKNVEQAATKVPHLHLAETVVPVPGTPIRPLPAPPAQKPEFPRVYGY